MLLPTKGRIRVLRCIEGALRALRGSTYVSSRYEAGGLQTYSMHSNCWAACCWRRVEGRNFSKGLVIVEVSNAPANLTVVDLPGLVGTGMASWGTSALEDRMQDGRVKSWHTHLA